MMLAEVAPAIPLKPGKAAAFYTYTVPRRDEKSIQVGSVVQVPLGPRHVAGTVLRLHRRRVPYPTKLLTTTDRPPLTPGQMAFATWLSTTMHSGLGYTLRLFFPPSSLSGNALLPPPLAPPKKGLPAEMAGGEKPRPALIIEKDDPQRFIRIKDLIAADRFKQVLVLVPEVSLVEPLQQALTPHFQEVHVYHSDRTPKQLSAVWQSVYKNQPLVVIGTQKALYLPWRTLSHVVLEEEYVETHKLWDQYPRLDNRYALPQLAALYGARLLTSSSIESLRTAHAHKAGVSQELARNPLIPKAKIVPLSFDDRRQGHLLPPAALTQLKNAVRRGERTIILHNQRGTWRTAVCTTCHQALRCPNCDSTVFVEGTKTKQRVQCRQCSYTGPLPEVCPQCQSKHLRAFGPGATKITATLAAVLPTASIANVSAGQADAGSHVSSADVVVGTTAIWRYAAAESFDHALWLFPESMLLYPDYRSLERAYLMLARLQKTIPARRRVTIVTGYRDLVQSTLGGSLEKIIGPLLRERARLHYPPFTDLVKLTCLARTEGKSLDRARAAREKIDTSLPAGVVVRGPYQGFNKKEAGAFATHLLIAGPLAELVPLYKDLAVDRAELSPAQIL